jgi:N-ethylmaleimide reductase
MSSLLMHKTPLQFETQRATEWQLSTIFADKGNAMSLLDPVGLFDPIELGAISAPNRILMAPLTRGRADAGFVPSADMKVHYAQRASAGLIISEATGISVEGLGWPAAPGIWSAEQTKGWQPVTDAVHKAGGRIICQLWHMGRIVHPDYLGGEPPVSSSATTAPGHAYTPTGKQPYAQARPLELAEIPRLLNDYQLAAENAKAAGFDGVQLHAANGYLIDQFLRDNSNFRADAYGGSIENRIRLLLEVTTRLIDVWGADRVSVRLSPNGDSQGANDSNPVPLFTAAAAALSALGIGFLELREPGPDGTFGQTDVPKISPEIRRVFAGPLVLNSDYDKAKAEADLASGVADAISFGRPFISNPDLPERLRTNASLNEERPRNWYSPGPEGYTDFPALDGTT